MFLIRTQQGHFREGQREYQLPGLLATFLFFTMNFKTPCHCEGIT